MLVMFLGWYDVGVSESSAAVCNIRQDDPPPLTGAVRTSVRRGVLGEPADDGHRCARSVAPSCVLTRHLCAEPPGAVGALRGADAGGAVARLKHHPCDVWIWAIGWPVWILGAARRVTSDPCSAAGAPA